MSKTTLLDGIHYEIIQTGTGTKYALVKDVSKTFFKTGATVEIPNYVGDAPVVEISSEAFSDIDFIRVVKLPNTIDRIASWAFDHCEGLEVVEIETGKKDRVSLGNNAFSRCYSLRTIVYNGEIWLEGPGVFKDCKNLYNIPVIRQMLPDGTFSNCSSLTRIHVVGKTNIHNRVFAGSSIKELFCHEELSWIAKDAETNESFANVTIITSKVTPMLEALAFLGQPIKIMGD